jgi:FkbM family methyltransferase
MQRAPLHPDTRHPGSFYHATTKTVPPWLRTHAERFRNDPFFQQISNEQLTQLLQYVRGNAYIDVIDLAGHPIELWLDDNIDFLIWVYGYYEIHESRMFLSLLRPGDVVVDVGANIGYYSILAASRINHHGKILAFEPVSSTYSRLRRNVQRIPSVEPYQMACGDEDGFVEIYVSDFRLNGQSGNSRILSPLPHNPNHKENVPATRLDTFFKKRGPLKVDLVKIDTEGYELKVLKGMKDIIHHNTGIKILVEMNEKFIRMGGSTPTDFFEYMNGFGLRPWRLIYTEANKWIFKEDNEFQGNHSLLLFSSEYPIPSIQHPASSI